MRPSIDRQGGDFAVRRTLEAEMRLLDEVEEVIVPIDHLDNAPAAGEGLPAAGEPDDLTQSAAGLTSAVSRMAESTSSRVFAADRPRAFKP